MEINRLDDICRKNAFRMPYHLEWRKYPGGNMNRQFVGRSEELGKVPNLILRGGRTDMTESHFLVREFPSLAKGFNVR